MKTGEKSRVNIPAVIFGILASGFAGIGLSDLMSGGDYILSGIAPDSIHNILPHTELGASLFFAAAAVVSVVIKIKNNSLYTEDTSDFDNNVFNYKDNHIKNETSNRYKQPDFTFPEELSDEYKEKVYGKKKLFAVENKYEEIEKISSKGKGEYFPEADESYINNMDSDFEEPAGGKPDKINGSDKPGRVLARADGLNPGDTDNQNAINAAAEEALRMLDKMNTKDLSPEASLKEQIISDSAVSTDNIDFSSLEKNQSVNINLYKNETIDTDEIDMSVIEQISEPDSVKYEQDSLNSNDLDTSALETKNNAGILNEYHHDTINTSDFDLSQLDEAFESKPNTYDASDTIETNNIDMSVLDKKAPDEQAEIEFIDIEIYGETPAEPKVYDFAKKAAELAAGSTDENGNIKSDSAYLNSYLELFSKPSSNTIYSSAKNNDNDLIYQSFSESFTYDINTADENPNEE